MAQCGDAAAGVLEHWNPVAAQPFRRGRIDRRSDRGQHRQRRVGGGRHVEDGVGIGGVTVELGDQVDRQRGDGHTGIVDHRLQARAEQIAGVGAGAPHVEGIARSQSFVELFADGRQCLVGQLGELHAQIVGEVGAQCPLRPRVVHGGDTVRAGPSPPLGLEKFDGVGELGDVADLHGTGVGTERLPARGVTGQRPGVRGDHGSPAGGVPDRQYHHGDVAFGGPTQSAAQTVHRPWCLQHEGDERGAVVGEDVVDVVGGVGHQFLSRGHGQPVAEAATCPQQGGERRTGVSHQRNPARRKGIRLEVAQRAQAGHIVDEAHASGAAHRHARHRWRW